MRLALGSTLLALSSFAATAPTAAPKVTTLAATRFLEQAAFGPSASSLAEVQAAGFSAWIDSQIAIPQSKWSVIPSYSTDSAGNTSLTPTQDGFFMNAVMGDDQLRQRVAFALAQIFVTSGVKLAPQAMVPYLKMLQADAFTTYDKLLYDVTLSPGMGHYLDMVNNNKATPGHGPNENYAREVLQLFSVGLYDLDSYGRVVKDSKGNPILTYDQDVVEGFAATFTGWTYAPLAGAVSKFGNPANWNAPMVAFEANHDKTIKLLLNNYHMPANQTAELDLTDALANISNHPNVAPFISRQLIQRLVTSNPSDDYVHRIVTVFNQSPRGSMAAVVKAILLDPEARQGDTGAENTATKLREPALWVSAFLRGLNAKVAAVNSVPGNVSVLGQNVYYPPTVFNYYLPGYEINLSSTSTYNAPEFQLLSEATAMSAADLVNSFSFGTVTGVTIDLTSYITPLGAKPTTAQITAMIDSLNANLMGGAMSATMQATVLKAVEAATTPKAMVETAVYLIGSSGNYQVAR